MLLIPAIPSPPPLRLLSLVGWHISPSILDHPHPILVKDSSSFLSNHFDRPTRPDVDCKVADMCHPLNMWSWHELSQYKPHGSHHTLYYFPFQMKKIKYTIILFRFCLYNWITLLKVCQYFVSIFLTQSSRS